MKKKVKKIIKTKKVEKKGTSANVALKKADDVLEKLSDKKKVLKKLDFQKTINAMAKTIGKMTEVIQAQEERIVKLENTPAQIKSKAAFVHKGNETKKEDSEKDGERATQINKRLKELEALKEKLGPNNFAKQGYSHEAGKLQAELEKLN